MLFPPEQEQAWDVEKEDKITDSYFSLQLRIKRRSKKMRDEENGARGDKGYVLFMPTTF